MKRIVFAGCILACVGFFAHTWAQDDDRDAAATASTDYFNVQGNVMECSPPKFMLISEVDSQAKTITGLSTIQRQTPEAPEPVISAFHRTFKMSEIEITNARRKAIGEDDFENLKGKLVVISEGKTPLSAAFLGLFREDTVVITIEAAKK